jgi:hypothetical protein
MITHNTPNRTPARHFNEWIEQTKRIEARCDTSTIRRLIEEIEENNRKKRQAQVAKFKR